MPIISPTLLAKLQITLTTVLGAFSLGVESYVETYLSQPHATVSWKAVAMGAIVAGAAAVRHHYMDPPTTETSKT